MKISNNIPEPIQPASKIDARASERLDRGRSRGDGVSLSPEAQWVNALKDQVKVDPEVRTDVVDRMKEALAAGTYESSIDMDSLVTNILADL